MAAVFPLAAIFIFIFEYLLASWICIIFDRRVVAVQQSVHHLMRQIDESLIFGR